MDADVVAAASAAAATSRTPFDDDDPEMIEDPNYGNGAAAAGAYGSAPMMQQYYNNYAPSTNEYEPSHFSAATGPGFAGMGAYGPAAAGAAGGAYGAYYANGAHAGSSNDNHYYDTVPGGQSAEGAAPAGYYSNSQGHEFPTAGEDGAQQQWGPSGHSPHLDPEGMPFSGPGRRGPADDNNNLFADPASHESGSGETDGRLDPQSVLNRSHEAGSSHSLQDNFDYGRKLTVKNPSDE